MLLGSALQMLSLRGTEAQARLEGIDRTGD
jgi:hypothetical protein